MKKKWYVLNNNNKFNIIKMLTFHVKNKLSIKEL